MDELITKVMRNQSVRWELLLRLSSDIFSAICALITQNIILTILYILGTSIINIFSIIYKDVDLKKIIKKLFETKDYKKYLFFIGIASLPTIVGILTKEITIFSSKIFLIKIFNNFVPNILGALIVCSLISHVLTFNREETIYAVIQSKRDFFDIIVRFGFLGAYLNAINYVVSDNWKWTNFFNSIHLFIIVFAGILIFTIFALRIVNRQFFCFTAKQVYPKQTLKYVVMFLMSCGFGPIVLKSGKHEPFLLAINTLTASIVVICLFVFIIRRTKKNSKEYPWMIVSFFLFLIIFNSVLNFMKRVGTVDVKKELASGIPILGVVSILLIWINILQKREDRENNESDGE